MPFLRGRCRGKFPLQLSGLPSHRPPQVARKELGVQSSTEGNIPSAMVLMDSRDRYLKKFVGWLQIGSQLLIASW